MTSLDIPNKTISKANKALKQIQEQTAHLYHKTTVEPIQTAQGTELLIKSVTLQKAQCLTTGANTWQMHEIYNTLI